MVHCARLNKRPQITLIVFGAPVCACLRFWAIKFPHDWAPKIRSPVIESLLEKSTEQTHCICSRLRCYHMVELNPKALPDLKSNRTSKGKMINPQIAAPTCTTTVAVAPIVVGSRFLVDRPLAGRCADLQAKQAEQLPNRLVASKSEYPSARF